MKDTNKKELKRSNWTLFILLLISCTLLLLTGFFIGYITHLMLGMNLTDKCLDVTKQCVDIINSAVNESLTK